MNDLVGFLVVCSFFALLGGSIYAISISTVGLDQKLSVPLKSYVADYFENMESYLMVGVPARVTVNFSNSCPSILKFCTTDFVPIERNQKILEFFTPTQNAIF